MRTRRPQPGVFLLTIGDEILDGRIQNTNASWFGERFRLAGIPVSESRSVPDRAPVIAAALRDAAAYPIILVTGGLGPTNDDRTLEGAGLAFRLPLVETAASLRHVRSRYRSRGLPLTPARRKMTLVPRGAEVLANPAGTAPGLRLRACGSDFFFLPGPPPECRPMFEKHVLPRAKRLLHGRRLLRRELWRTFGRGESEIYGRVELIIEALERRFPESVAFGVHISFPYIDVTLEAREAPGGKRPSLREMDEAAGRVSAALGGLCFSRERESLAEVVARLLVKERKNVCAAESCTGGLLGKLLTDIPGSSSYFLGGAITYANSAKEALLGVNKLTLQSRGAVSGEAAREMAEGARRKLGADFALAISGVAGPGGGTPSKPVGTIYVALSTGGRTRILHQVILQGQGSRDQNRVVAAHLALDALRAELLGFPESGIPIN